MSVTLRQRTFLWAEAQPVANSRYAGSLATRLPVCRYADSLVTRFGANNLRRRFGLQQPLQSITASIGSPVRGDERDTDLRHDPHGTCAGLGRLERTRFTHKPDMTDPPETLNGRGNAYGAAPHSLVTNPKRVVWQGVSVWAAPSAPGPELRRMQRIFEAGDSMLRRMAFVISCFLTLTRPGRSLPSLSEHCVSSPIFRESRCFEPHCVLTTATLTCASASRLPLAHANPKPQPYA